MQGISDLALEINPQIGRFSGEQIDRLIAALRRAGGSDETIKDVITQYHTEYMMFGAEEFTRSIECLFPDESYRDSLESLKKYVAEVNNAKPRVANPNPIRARRTGRR